MCYPVLVEWWYLAEVPACISLPPSFLPVPKIMYIISIFNPSMEGSSKHTPDDYLYTSRKIAASWVVKV